MPSTRYPRAGHGKAGKAVEGWDLTRTQESRTFLSLTSRLAVHMGLSHPYPLQPVIQRSQDERSQDKAHCWVWWSHPEPLSGVRG